MHELSNQSESNTIPSLIARNGELVQVRANTLHAHMQAHMFSESQCVIHIHGVLWGYYCSVSGDRVHYRAWPHDTVLTRHYSANINPIIPSNSEKISTNCDLRNRNYQTRRQKYHIRK